MSHPQCNCPLASGGTNTIFNDLHPALSCGTSTPFVTFLGFLELLLRSQCDISDPCRPLRFDRTDPPDGFDFIVIGAGAAGAAVAGRLSEADNGRHRVLLIEAGGDQVLRNDLGVLFSLYEWTSSFNMLYETIPNDRSYLNKRPVRWSRGKLLGGCTSINGQVYIRGSREDFDQWASMGNRGWSYADVLPYFRRAEDHRSIDSVDREYHGTGGPVPVSVYPLHTPAINDCMQAAVDSGFTATDLNGANSSGAMYVQTTSLNGIRMDTSRAYLHPAWNRPNLYIRINVQATRVLIDPVTHRAFGVEAVDLANGRSRMQWLASKEVIVAAGTIESPKLLMHSGIGPAAHLREFNIQPVVDLPGVGENVQNHVAIMVQAVATNRTQPSISRADLVEYVRLREGPLVYMKSLLYVHLNTLLAADNNGGGHDVQLTFLDNFHWTADVCPSLSNASLALVLSAMSILLRPHSRGQIRLASDDPLQPPTILSDDLNDSRDVDAILEGVRHIERILAADALIEYGLEMLPSSSSEACARHEWRSDAYWRCAIRQETIDFSHPAGSCKMAPPDDPYRVVDHALRVYGVPGLRVIDASIMPLVVAGNTMAATTMIGEKGAQMVLDAWS